MSESVIARLWNAVKPPPPAEKRAKKPMTAQRRKQLRMIGVVFALLILGGAGWEVYAYIASAPDRAKAKFDEAMIDMGPGNYQKAIAGFTRAVAIWPRLADAYVQRGLAHHYLSEDYQALSDLDQALTVDSNSAQAHLVRGTILRDRKNTQAAMDEFTKSIQSQPGLDAYYERGQLYESLGQHEKAIADYDQAIEYLRNAPHVYRARAYAKANMGDLEGAKADRELAENYEHR